MHDHNTTYKKGKKGFQHLFFYCSTFLKKRHEFFLKQHDL